MVRAKGSGSVFPLCAERHGCPPKIDADRPDHKCKAPWRGQIEAGFTASGARRYVTVTGKSEKDATTKLRSKSNELERDGVPKSGSSTMTIKRWSDEWLPAYQQNVRPNRWTDARGVVRRYIVPTIGAKRLSALRPSDIRAVHAAVAEAGFGQSTALRAHDVLKVMLKAAMHEGYRVPGNAIAEKRPKVKKSDRDAIPMPDALAILRAAGELPDTSRWVAAFLQGMRQGECLGLTWDCVDFDRGLIDVSWQLQPLPYADRQAKTFRVPADYEHRQLLGQMHLVRPKSQSGTRVIPLVPWMARALASWWELAPPNSHGLVWTDSSRPIRKHTDRLNWFALQDAAQVARIDGKQGDRYTLHQARHTCATLLLEVGVDQHVVTSIMGHSRITTSRGYQHVSQRMSLDALERVAKVLQLEA